MIAVVLPEPHSKQWEFINSTAKRKIVCAGRRGGKTVGMAILAVQWFLERNARVLYAAPTQEQVDAFWYEVKAALAPLVDNKTLRKNETRHLIELPGTKQRIRAKSAWDADTLRGDYADLLILDEYQLMNESAWERIGAPMMADKNGSAVFIYTPPGIETASRTKAIDPYHASKMFRKAQLDLSGHWQTFRFTSYDNPYISQEALGLIAQDMSSFTYQQEIMALDMTEAPGALWRQKTIEQTRVGGHPELTRIVIGVDPPGGRTLCGLVVVGLGIDGHGYVLKDASMPGTPNRWASRIVELYHEYQADRVIVEKNFGGDMVENTVRMVEGGADLPIHAVPASRGKQVRAEPVAAIYERGMAHHVGVLPELEGELCMWQPGDPSPNRLDAMVWAFFELRFGAPAKLEIHDYNPFMQRRG